MSVTTKAILFVNNLAKTVTESMLHNVFNDYTVSYIKIAKSHETKESFGYCFVGLRSVKDGKYIYLTLHMLTYYLLTFIASNVVDTINYTKLENKTIQITWFNRDEEITKIRNELKFNLFVKNLNKEVTPKEFVEHFSKHGNVLSARLMEDENGKSMGFGFILYHNQESVDVAIKENHETIFRDKKLFVGPFIKNRPRNPVCFNNLFVKNIPKSLPEDKVVEIFTKYGEVSSYIIKETDINTVHGNLSQKKLNQINNHKFGFICFKTFSSAMAAIIEIPYLKISDSNYNEELKKLVMIFSAELDINKE